jgi:hypothetical protein
VRAFTFLLCACILFYFHFFVVLAFILFSTWLFLAQAIFGMFLLTMVSSQLRKATVCGLSCPQFCVAQRLHLEKLVFEAAVRAVIPYCIIILPG